MSQATKEFKSARDFLLQHRNDYAAAYSGFRWPKLDQFNWALDWFDVYAKDNAQIALHLVTHAAEKKFKYSELADLSSRVASGLRELGLMRGERILIMLGNHEVLWEAMLASQKMGAVVVPTSTQSTIADLEDRLSRGKVQMIITDHAHAEKFETLESVKNLVKVLADGKRPGWISFDDLRASTLKPIVGLTYARDPFLLYFTSGTTSKPKLVLHTHESYPVGHLSTMYWIGLREKSIHQNISSPGWAKHAWSSFFAPFNAGATVLMHEYSRFRPETALEILRKYDVNSLCAPPTVWRMLIQSQLKEKPAALQDLVSAGEPLNPEIIDHVSGAWGLKIRDGFGQSETSALAGNTPGSKLKPGSMGRALPGFRLSIIDEKDQECDEGEVALQIDGVRPTGLMQEYVDDPKRTQLVMSTKFYRTGDEAMIDSEGHIHFVGRGDDVFKSSDYRISPFELESVLMESHMVAESAVIPSPDPLRLFVPKAVIILKAEFPANAETAEALFKFIKETLAPYKQIRRIEFADLPKTISGKIRRVQLRKDEELLRKTSLRASLEFWAEDFK